MKMVGLFTTFSPATFIVPKVLQVVIFWKSNPAAASPFNCTLQSCITGLAGAFPSPVDWLDIKMLKSTTSTHPTQGPGLPSPVTPGISIHQFLDVSAIKSPSLSFVVLSKTYLVKN